MSEHTLEFDRSLRPLDPRAVTLWRVGAALSAVIWVPLLFGAIWFVDMVATGGVPNIPRDIAVASSLGVLQAGVRILVLAKIRYRWWRFQLAEDHLHLQRGLWWVRRTMIPLVRVQNVDTVQGPIARQLGLWSVVVFTAANAQSIPALSEAEADQLRRTLAELARRARDEDAA